MSKRLRHFPNNILYSGYVNGSSLNNRGSNGSFWSSTAISSNDAYNLGFFSSGVYPGTGYNFKYYGRTVRCVAGGTS